MPTVTANLRTVVGLGMLRSILVILLVLVAGCSEWNKYWDPSPTGPEVDLDLVPPVVRIVSPSGGDSTSATPVSGDDYAIVIEAEDDHGVARVSLQVDDQPAVDIAGPPWEISWNTTPLPETSVHRFLARAYDGSGNVGSSDTVYAQVFNSGPDVELAQPLDGARVLGTVLLEAAFVGETPPIAKVDFLDGSTLLDSVTTTPWSLMLDTNTLTGGDHFITVRATTELGGIGVSDAVRIRVNNAAPQLTVVFPEDGRKVATRGTLILSGDAVDPVDGAIASNQMTWTSSIDGPIGTGRYLRRKNLTVGMHVFTVTAVNAWGTEGSASITVEVMENPTYGFCNVVEPTLFVQRGCTICHSESSPEYDLHWLDLNSYQALMFGGRTQWIPTIVPCKPDSSLVWNKLTAEVPWVGEPMPPRDQYPAVPPQVLDRLRTWILEGAPPDDPVICP